MLITLEGNISSKWLGEKPTNQSNLKKMDPPMRIGRWLTRDPHLAGAPAPDVKTFTASLSRAPWCQAALQMWKLKREGLQEDVTWWLPWNPGWFFAGGGRRGREVCLKTQGFRVATNPFFVFFPSCKSITNRGDLCRIFDKHL